MKNVLMTQRRDTYAPTPDRQRPPRLNILSPRDREERSSSGGGAGLVDTNTVFHGYRAAETYRRYARPVTR